MNVIDKILEFLDALFKVPVTVWGLVLGVLVIAGWLFGPLPVGPDVSVLHVVLMLVLLPAAAWAACYTAFYWPATWPMVPVLLALLAMVWAVVLPSVVIVALPHPVGKLAIPLSITLILMALTLLLPTRVVRV